MKATALCCFCSGRGKREFHGSLAWFITTPYAKDFSRCDLDGSAFDGIKRKSIWGLAWMWGEISVH